MAATIIWVRSTEPSHPRPRKGRHSLVPRCISVRADCSRRGRLMESDAPGFVQRPAGNRALSVVHRTGAPPPIRHRAWAVRGSHAGPLSRQASARPPVHTRGQRKVGSVQRFAGRASDIRGTAGAVIAGIAASSNRHISTARVGAV